MGGRPLEGLSMVGKTLVWTEELERWLKPFLNRLAHKARRRMCPLYGLAYRRTPRFRREEILPRKSADRDRPAQLGRHHQGAMDLRTGSSAAERGTRP